MKQLSMFDKPETAPYVAGSETSKAAAERIEPSMASMRGKVLAFLREHGPHTDEEMQNLLHMNPSTQRPRRIELVRDGFVREYVSADGITCRQTRSHAWAQLWEAV